MTHEQILITFPLVLTCCCSWLSLLWLPSGSGCHSSCPATERGSPCWEGGTAVALAFRSASCTTAGLAWRRCGVAAWQKCEGCIPGQSHSSSYCRCVTGLWNPGSEIDVRRAGCGWAHRGCPRAPCASWVTGTEERSWGGPTSDFSTLAPSLNIGRLGESSVKAVFSYFRHCALHTTCTGVLSQIDS